MFEDIVFTGRDILLDTNLLVVLIIGSVNPRLFKFSRFAEYTVADYELLRSILRLCRSCLTTPSIVAETSNILDKAGEYWAKECRRTLGTLLHGWVEVYVESTELLSESDNEIALTLGIADGSTLAPAKNGALILTEDGPLAAWLSNLGHGVHEFQVIRNLRKSGYAMAPNKHS